MRVHIKNGLVGSIEPKKLGDYDVTELRVVDTARKRNRDTGEWADDGDPLWVSISFWRDEAASVLANVSKGDRVTVSGEFVVRSYTKSDGTTGQGFEIKGATLWGVQKKQPQEGTQAALYGAQSTPMVPQPTQGGYNPSNQPTVNQGFNDAPPF